MRDVIAFCGPDNAGFESNIGMAYHTWVNVGDSIADFSVGDWRTLDPGMVELTYPGAPNLGPIQWTIPTPPNYWWRPRSELTGPWRTTGTPELGKAWYGPFNGSPLRVQRAIREIRDDIGDAITRAVNSVIGQYARREFGITPNSILPAHDAPNPTIVQSQTNHPPLGYQQTTLSEIFRIAGASIGADFHDAVAYVTRIPTSREEAIAILRNMTITIPPG